MEDIIVKKKAFPKVKSVASITEPQIEKLDTIIHYFRIIGKRNFVSDADKLHPKKLSKGENKNENKSKHYKNFITDSFYNGNSCCSIISTMQFGIRC